MDSPNAQSDIEWLRDKGVQVGAGTVLTLQQASAAEQSGAQFLMAPHLDEEIVGWASAGGIPMAPGALTPTEIIRAWNFGAAAVKIFPASVAGTALLREVRGPLGHVPLIPTGGISADNARSFITEGAIAVGVGSWLTSAAHDQVESRWRALVTAVRRSDGHIV
jgi:2-dehydro-3-deoxyphosphogluconate aldolase/(4S)-4-hydroxy-2-oxoglutarate aldolase